MTKKKKFECDKNHRKASFHGENFSQWLINKAEKPNDDHYDAIVRGGSGGRGWMAVTITIKSIFFLSFASPYRKSNRQQQFLRRDSFFFSKILTVKINLNFNGQNLFKNSPFLHPNKKELISFAKKKEQKLIFLLSKLPWNDFPFLRIICHPFSLPYLTFLLLLLLHIPVGTHEAIFIKWNREKKK